MAPHSSTLAWKIPWTEEPRRLQSMGSLRVGHNWATSLSLFTFMHWRRKWQPTPVFLPGESQGWGSLVGCRILALEIPWRGAWWAIVHGIARVRHDLMTKPATTPTRRGEREWLVNGMGFIWGDENILELDRVGGFITLSMYQTALNVPFKMVNFKINIVY